MTMYFYYERGMSGKWNPVLTPDNPDTRPAYNGKESVPVRKNTIKVPISEISDYNAVLHSLIESNPPPKEKISES